jgi:hypothetical protein
MASAAATVAAAASGGGITAIVIKWRSKMIPRAFWKKKAA